MTDPRHPEFPTVRDRQRRQAVADLTAVPRCPSCRAPLVARVTGAGPHFTCQCKDHRFT